MQAKIGDIVCANGDKKNYVYIQGDGYYNTLKCPLAKTATGHFPGSTTIYVGFISFIDYPCYTEEFLKNIPQDQRENIIKGLLSRDKDVILFTLDIIKSYGER